MAELTVKSKFFGMEDKVEVNNDEVTQVVAPIVEQNETVSRFKKVYLDEIPEEVLEELNAHFDDETSKVTLFKSELTNFVWTNLLYLHTHIQGNPNIATVKYDTITFEGLLTSGDSIGWYYPAGSPSSATDKLNLNNTGKFSLMLDSEDAPFDNSVSFTYSSNYQEAKQAVIKDLLTNLGYKVVLTKETVEGMVAEVPNVEEAPSGTIQKVLGLNSSGKVVKGSVSGGTKLYKHEFEPNWSDFSFTGSITIITNINTPITKNNLSLFNTMVIISAYANNDICTYFYYDEETHKVQVNTSSGSVDYISSEDDFTSPDTVTEL